MLFHTAAIGFDLTEFAAARRPFDERGGKADLPHAANDALEAPPASEPSP